MANIASSGLLLLAATNAVPEKFDYFNGKPKVMEALGVIPFGRFFMILPVQVTIKKGL